MLEDFIKVAEMPQDAIEKYRDRVPEGLVEIWEKQGLGTFLDGYLKVINPEEYDDFVKQSYFDGAIATPVFLTAFGDVIVWESDGYLVVLEYKSEDVDSLIKNFNHFLRFYNHEIVLEELDIPLYKKAIKKFGPLEYDECFGFVPILPLGGKKDVKHMDKVKIREHLYLLVQFTGGIFD